MVIIERYLAREILRTFGAVFGLLLLIFISSRFVQFLSDAAAGKLGSDVILTMLLLNVLTVLGLLTPLCFYLATYLVLNRMQRDNEVIAIGTSGLGRPFLVATALKLAVAVTIAVLIATLLVSPWAEAHISELEAQAKQQADIMGISPGRFKELSRGDRVIYVESMSDDKKQMRNVFLQVRQKDELGVLTSAEARLEPDPATGDRFVVFTNGNRYTGTPGSLDYSVTHYEKYAVRIEQNETDADHNRVRAVPTTELLVGDTALYHAEFQWRLSLGLSVLLLAALAVLMVRSARGVGKYSGLLTVIFIYFTYSNLLGIARTLLKKGEIPGSLGLWWVHGLLLLVIAVLASYPLLRRGVSRGPGLRGAQP